MIISYKQEKLNIEKELLYKERMEIEKKNELTHNVRFAYKYKNNWTDKLQDEYFEVTQIRQNRLIEIRKKIDEIMDEEKRNSDEISKLNI